MVKKSVLIILFLCIFSIIAFGEDVNETVPQDITDFEITSFIPQEFNVGDVQFNIQIKNIGTTELKNLAPLITGNGFSTYNIVPIDSLKAGEKSYVLVMGNFKTEGVITLTIKINDKIFYQEITVKNSELIKQEEQTTEDLQSLSDQLKILKENYDKLEKNYNEKKGKYDLSGINLDELKRLVRDAELNILSKDTKKAEISLTLGSEEYISLKEKLNNAKVIKKSAWIIFRENIVVFSTVAASIITLFTFYELMKKKKETVEKKVTEKFNDIVKPKKEEKQ